MKFVVKASVTKEFTSFTEAREYYWSERTWSRCPVFLIAIDGEYTFMYNGAVGAFFPVNH